MLLGDPDPCRELRPVQLLLRRSLQASQPELIPIASNSKVAVVKPDGPREPGLASCRPLVGGVDRDRQIGCDFLDRKPAARATSLLAKIRAGINIVSDAKATGALHQATLHSVDDFTAAGRGRGSQRVAAASILRPVGRGSAIGQ
jgi:hypothetical protein